MGKQKEQLLNVIAELKGTDGCLIPVLQEAQKVYGYLPEEAQQIVAEELNIPVSEVYSVVSFYSDLKLTEDDKGEKCTEFESANEAPDTEEQTRVVLRNYGLVDPRDINSYVARNGYQALEKVLKESDPVAVIETVKASGLRGRGGANFPTGVKWESAYHAAAEKKYVICNANEGDPGVFMDRCILAADPHSVIEGLLIAAYATGASKGIIYLREQSPRAEESLRCAVEAAEKAGYLGKNILGSDFNFELEIRIGAGAYVSGEETALIASIEGKRAEPALKPPYPFEKGVFGYPTTINNTETLASVAPIILNGADWYRALGSENNAGTKVLAVTGDIAREGLVEVRMGTSLRKVVEACGGMKDGKTFKAAFAGGPSGGVVTDLDAAIDYASFAKLGAAVGSGGITIYSDGTSMVDVAKELLSFSAAESCGKCNVCRIGMKRMEEMLDKFVNDCAEKGDIEKLEELAVFVKNYSRCGLGQTAPNPVLSTIHNFCDEYQEKIGM